MADERHEWLDREAAERLLRGEGVEPGDERARAEADRLTALLRSLGPTEPATTELPGEEAALAAFRKARPEGAADNGEALGVVRVGRVAQLPESPRRRRFAPVRLGLAAALACCAIGGVAVAAGTGVLPGPFASDEHDPAPASTVSAAVTPGPVATSPSHSLPPGSPSPDRAAPSSGAPTPGDPTRPASPSGPATGGTSDPGRKDGTQPGGDPGEGEGDAGGAAAGGQWLARTTEACREYRSGKLDTAKRRDLESEAHGSAALKGFCDLVLDGRPGKSGSAAGSGGNGPGGGGRGNGKGKGDGDSPEHKYGGGGGGKQSSVVPHPGKLLDWLRPGALGPAVSH
ncbi:hypothetical protein [Streptomyces sp. NPDC001828]|uniref:hypothetical protein n=1 Tax=Streptomyces sp. NPDC001828 TaxID=3364615 RepID=UPI00369EB8CD